MNFGRSIKESGTLPPLETEDARESDHKVAWAIAEFVAPVSKQVTYSYRAYTERGANNFLTELNAQSWEAVYSAHTTYDKAEMFLILIEELLNRNFKWKTVVRNESDPPWIKETLRSLWKKRRRVYNKEGRSRR